MSGDKKERKKQKDDLPIREDPQNEIAERAVLGGMITEPDLIARARIEGLEVEDFYYPEHRVLFSLLTELYERRGKDWDDITFIEFTKKKNIDFPMGLFYAIAEEGTTGYLWEEAFRVVKEASLLRQSDQIALRMLQSQSIEELYALKESLEGLLERVKKEEKSLRELVNEEIERIKRARETSQLVQGVGTGFLELDTRLLGFEGGQLIVVGARPGMGKSSFMLSLALNMAKHHRVGIFSLEMSAGQLIQRALSIMSGVPLHNIRRGFISDEDWDRIVNAGLELVKLNLSVDDKPIQTAMEIKAKSKWAGYEIIFIDYLQLIKTEKRYSRQEEVAEISMALKAMAKQLNVPVVALAQLNRGTETRSNKRPTLADLRESGQIEQDADIIIFLHRPEYYSRGDNAANLVGRAEVIIAKNRQGPTGLVEMRFDKDTTGFYPAGAAAAPEIEEEEGDDFEIDF